jgi:cytochrome c oxidase subunit IV
VKSLIFTYLMLMILLVLTIGASKLQLGDLQTPVSIGIAVLKAALVLWIFMDLKESSTLIRIAAGAVLLWIFFFYFLAGLDIGFRVKPKAVSCTHTHDRYQETNHVSFESVES